MCPAPALSRPLYLLVLGLVLVLFFISGQGAALGNASSTPNNANTANATSSHNGDGVGLAEYSPEYPECSGRTLLVSPSKSMGLNNQVDLLVHAIYVGIVTNRMVCMRGFMPQFNSTNMINIGWIYDVTHINRVILSSGILQRIRPNDKTINRNSDPKTSRRAYLAPTHGEHYTQSVCLVLKGEGASGMRNCPNQYKNIGIRDVEKNYQGIIQFLQRSDISTLDMISVTNGVPFVRTGYETPEDDLWINEIHMMVRFAQPLYEISKIIMADHGFRSNTPYTAVHFRLEDDALEQFWKFNWWEYEELPSVKAAGTKFQWPREEHDLFLASRFIRSIIATVQPREGKIFASTGLAKSAPSNRLDFLMSLLTAYFPNLFSINLLASGQHTELPISGREVAAIVDYIISTKADHFVGISASVFSANAMRHIKHKSGIKSMQYGKAETRLHERAIAAALSNSSSVDASLSAESSRSDSEQLSVFSKNSYLFSIRDMGLPPLLPRTLHDINATFAIPGICSGFHLVNLYRKLGQTKRKPFGELFPTLPE